MIPPSPTNPSPSRRYRFQATETFWRNFYALPSGQKASVREKWLIFKQDPFHPSLGVHKIHSLSAKAKRTVHSVVIESDLRVLFVVEGNCIKSLDVGSHEVYG